MLTDGVSSSGSAPRHHSIARCDSGVTGCVTAGTIWPWEQVIACGRLSRLVWPNVGRRRRLCGRSRPELAGQRSDCDTQER
jgi:hypothetical protein